MSTLSIPRPRRPLPGRLFRLPRRQPLVPALATGGRTHVPVCSSALLSTIARIDAERAAANR